MVKLEYRSSNDKMVKLYHALFNNKIFTMTEKNEEDSYLKNDKGLVMGTKFKIYIYPNKVEITNRIPVSKQDATNLLYFCRDYYDIDVINYNEKTIKSTTIGNLDENMYVYILMTSNYKSPDVHNKMTSLSGDQNWARVYFNKEDAFKVLSRTKDNYYDVYKVYINNHKIRDSAELIKEH